MLVSFEDGLYTIIANGEVHTTCDYIIAKCIVETAIQHGGAV